MKLEQLYEMQKVLDAKIIDEKGLRGIDLLPNTVLALQVELGECANEWRGFKHWSNDQQPRTNKMLVEYVDCLHFILSLGLRLGITDKYKFEDLIQEFSGVNEAFRHTFNWLSSLDFVISNKMKTVTCYSHMFNAFIALGKLLGFTWEQIESAYIDKNEVNHQRQDNGY
ncbi:MAG: dUTP diphosphatase [Bacillota bacterium]